MADMIRQCPWCRRDRYNNHSPDCVPDVSLLYRGNGVPVGNYTEDFYFDIDTNMIYFNNGLAWIQWGLAGPINGNYNFGTNNIINAGTYNGITLESHASRHLPNGLDPLTTAAPLTDLTANTTNIEGSAISFSRSDHSHAIDTGTPITQTPDQINSTGTSSNLARADHVHNIPTATPVSIGDANTHGSASSFALSDHIHQGIHSLNANSGPATYGDVTLQSGTGMNIVSNNGTFTFNSTDGGTDFYVTQGLGLDVNYMGGKANINGTVILISSGSISLTPSTLSGIIYIDLTGIVTQSTSGQFDPTVIPLATYSTNATDIISLTDFRIFVNNNLIFGNTANISTITATAVSSEGITNTYAMGDHVHAISTGSASTQTPDQINSTGTSSNLARADHVHNIPTAAPIINLSADTTNVQGITTTFARSDHSHALNTGTPITQTPDQINSVGTSSDLARADHVHNIPTSAPISQLPNQINSDGIATTFARSDHIHNIPTGEPVSIGPANTQGIAATFAQSDHVHQGIHSLKVGTNGTSRYGDIVYVPGDNMTITDDGAGNFNFSSSIGTSSLTWTSVTGTGSVIQGDINTGYMNNSSTAQLKVLLPLNPAINTRFAIGDISGGWQITQNASQSIIFTNLKNAYPFTVNFTTTGSIQNWSSIAVSSDATKQVAVVNGGYIYTSTDSGVTWVARQTDSTRAWSSVASSSDGTMLVACVDGGQIWTSADSGITWIQQSSGTGAWVSVCSSSNGTSLAAVQNGNKIYISTNSGVTWKANASIKNWMSIACSSDASKLIASVNGGQVWVSIDSGNTWTAENYIRNWKNVASSADGNVLAASVTGGQIYISRDSGTSWAGFANAADWGSIAMSQDGNRILAGQGTDGYLYSYSFNDGNWLQLTNTGTSNWSGIACSSDGNKWTACSNTSSGKLIISTASTTVGTTGSIIGKSNSTLDLLCVATNTYMALTSTGSITPS